MNRSNDAPVPIDPEHGFEDLASSLDMLGAYERAQMPSDLPDRTMMRTQSLLHRPAPEPVVHRSRLLGLAASVALLASIGVLVVLLRSGSPAPSQPGGAIMTQAALDLDLLDGPDWDGELDAEIAVLLAESTMLDGDLDRDLTEFDLFSDEGAL